MLRFNDFLVILLFVLRDRPEGHIFALDVPANVLGLLLILLHLWKGPFSVQKKGHYYKLLIINTDPLSFFTEI